MEAPTIGKLSSMYMYAWKRGIKTTYYLRSRPATSIAKTTTTMKKTETATPVIEKKSYSDAEVIACSIDNPEACEACQ
jgi:ribonucleoside-diphosphate reductase alpha chain